MTSKESISEYLGTVIVTLLFLVPALVVSAQNIGNADGKYLQDTDLDGVIDYIDVIDDDYSIQSFGVKDYDTWPKWRKESITFSESADKVLLIPHSKDTKPITVLIGNQTIWEVTTNQLFELWTLESGESILASVVMRLSPDDSWSLIIATDALNVRIITLGDEGLWVSEVMGQTITQVHDLAVGDVDHDGFPDVVAMYENGTAELWDNVAGDLRISPTLNFSGYDCERDSSCSMPVAWTFNDMDQDGDIDMISGWQNGDVILHVRNARGEWEDSLLRDSAGLEEWPDPVKEIICTDIDGTGYDDLLVVSDVLLEIWINSGYTFNRSNSLHIYDIEEAEILHLDGGDDVHLIVRHEDGRIGSGTLSQGITWSPISQATGLAAFDLGEDGDIDVAILQTGMLHIHENGPGITEILQRAIPAILIILGIAIYALHTQWRYNRDIQKK